MKKLNIAGMSLEAKSHKQKIVSENFLETPENFEPIFQKVQNLLYEKLTPLRTKPPRLDFFRSYLRS